MSQQPSPFLHEPAAFSEVKHDEPAAKKAKKDKGRKRSDRRRSVDTMFRVTYQNHVALSQLADGKANTLISINGLIVSIVMAVVTPRFGSLTWMLAPTLVLAAGCIVSLVFAVVGSRPRLNRTPVSLEQVRNNDGNILFFGQFARLPLPDFQDAMNALCAEPRLLRAQLVRQLHSMGLALECKYRNLHAAYIAFLAGIGGSTAVLVAVLVGGAA